MMGCVNDKCDYYADEKLVCVVSYILIRVALPRLARQVELPIKPRDE